MTDQTPPAADPLAGAPTPAPATTPPTADAASPAPASDVEQLAQLVAALQAETTQLRADLAARPPAGPAVSATGTAAVAAPAPAAVAPGAPAAATHTVDSLDAHSGDVIRYTIPDNGSGGGTSNGYGLVLDVVDIDDETGGVAQPGRPSHPELIVAQLQVLGTRLTADNVVDEERSSALHAQAG